MIESFNLHGLAGFRLTSDDLHAVRYFSSEYRFALDTLIGSEPVVTLRWKRSALPRSPGSGYKLRIHKAAARWYYRIELSQKEVLIEASGNKTAIPMVHHMLLHPALRWLTSHHGSLLLHSAGVAQNGRGFLISGAGGAGKTTTSSGLLVDSGPNGRLLGDDYVFIGPDERAYSYRTRAHVYLDLIQRFPELSSRLSVDEQIRLRANWFIRRISEDRIKIPVRVELDRLWPDRGSLKSAQPVALLLLQKFDQEHPLLKPASDRAAVTDELLRINFFEARHFIELLGESDAWLEAWKRRERRLMAALMERVPAYTLLIPRGTADLRTIVFDLFSKESTAHGPIAQA